MKTQFYLSTRKTRAFIVTILCVVLSIGANDNARASGTTTLVNYSGSYNVGTTGTWTSLRNAFTALAAGNVTGPVSLVLQSTYLSTAESSFPIAPSAIPGTNATNTVTVYPSVSGLSITSSSGTGTINLNGVDYVVFDGRVGATGTTINLIIQNTSTTGYAVQFTGGALYDKLQYCNIKGMNTSGTSGVIYFASGTASSNNTIDNCEVGPSTSAPRNLIFSVGAAGQVNTNNTISNCILHDYYNNSGNTATGVYCSTNNTSWTITGNSIYQTSSRANAKLDAIACYSGQGYTISNNYIGGTTVNCGGTTLTITGSNNNLFNGIYFDGALSTATVNTVSGNTIQNIAITATPNSNARTFCGLQLLGGNNTVSNNTIGSGTGNGSIIVTTNGNTNASFISGIYSLCNLGSIQSNTIGSINLANNSSSSNGVQTFYGIYLDPGTAAANMTISGNTIGSASTANSIHTIGPDGYIPQTIKGIYAVPEGTTYSITVSNNIVANILNANTKSGTTTFVNGIEGKGTNGLVNITGNSVHDITSASRSNLTGPGATVSGIVSTFSGTTQEQLISQNTVYSLISTNVNASEPVTCNGICVESKALVERNFVHSLSLASLSIAATSGATGIQLNPGSINVPVTCRNNIVRLGLDASGNSLTTGTSFAGIWMLNANTTNTIHYTNVYYIYNNSLFIDGAGAAATPVFSACIFSENSGTRTIKNNICYNTRTGTGDEHFAMVLSDYAAAICDYNCLYRPEGEGYSLISSGVTFTSTPDLYNELEDWQASGRGFDAHSVENEPGYVDENGPTPNLHMRPSAGPCSNAGATGTGVTVDFDGETRSGTPDIGADEYSDPVAITWTGNLSNAWNSTSNWAVSTVPKRADIIVIPSGKSGYPIVASGYRAGAYNVTIQPGGSITINPNGAMDITGTITNNNDVDGIVIESDATGTGSLKQKFDGTKGTIQRYASGSGNLTDMMYHMVSVPCTPSSANYSVIFLESYLFEFNESTNAWNGLGAPTGTPLDETKGYLTYAPFASDTYKFKNPMNSGLFTAKTTYSGASSNDITRGWNLIPNPYASAINWSSIKGWTKTNIDGGIYFWPAGASSLSSNYKSFSDGLGVGNSGATRYIPVGQSFFVHANAASPVLSMTNRVRVHNTQAFWKNSEKDTILPNLLRLQCITGDMNDDIIVAFREDATDGFDSNYDTYKMQGGDDAPQMATVTDDGIKLSISALPYSFGEKIIPISFSLRNAAEVTFTATGMESFTMVPPIFLEDHVTNQVIDLQQNPVYTFNYEPGQKSRFFLRFINITNTKDQTKEEGFAFYTNGKLNIEVPSMQGQQATISIFDVTGRSLKSETVNLSGVVQIDAPTATGVYIVRIFAGSRVFTQKIYVD